MNKLIRSHVMAVVAVLAVATLACAGADYDNDMNDNAVDNDNDTAVTVEVNDMNDDVQAAEVSCEMTFTMEGWSAIISKAEGEGVVTCDNGQRADVELEVDGAGLTVGKTEIDEGRGVFSDVKDISEIFGSYAQGEANAGAVEAVSAQALTKGSVSLAITTKGRGWSLGVSGAKFVIERAANTTDSDMGS